MRVFTKFKWSRFKIVANEKCIACNECSRNCQVGIDVMSYALKQETHHDWRYRDGPNESDSKVFTVVFNPDLRVVSTMSVPDPDLERNR